MIGNEQELINRLKDLQDFADDLCYRMIEADGPEYEKLKINLELVEDEIEQLELRLG